MRATDWEFKNRGIIFGFIFGLPFVCYAVDHTTTASWLGARLAPTLAMSEFTATRLMLGAAALFAALAAGVRTWASAYLNADVVYASEVKSAALVADGPYRLLRNPLYFGNCLLGMGMGLLMSRLGFAVEMACLITFCYRLILREESELRANQGDSFAAYVAAVPRLWPSPWPKVASAGRLPKWGDGFVAESWCWGFAAAMLVFAVTLNSQVFYIVMGVSLLAFYALSAMAKKRPANNSE